MAEKVQINLQLEAEEKRMIEKNAKDEGVSVSEFIRMKCIDESGCYVLMAKEKGKRDTFVKTSGARDGSGNIKIETTENIAQAETMTFGKAKSLKTAIELLENNSNIVWQIVELEYEYE